MKRKLFVLLFAVSLLVSCNQETDYHFDISYIDGTKEHLIVPSANDYITPVLEDGCIIWYGGKSAIVCGVKSFTYYTTDPKK